MRFIDFNVASSVNLNMKQVQVKLLLCFLLATCITGQYAGQPFGGQQPVLGQSSISAWGGLQGPGTFLPHLASKSLLGAKTIGEPLAAETTASYAEPAAPQIPVSIARPAAIREFSATYGQPAAVPQAPRTALHCHTEPDLPQVAVPVQTTILKSADSSYGSSSSANAQALTNIIRSTGSSYESNGNFAAPTMNTLVKSAGSSYGNTENFAVPAINTMAKASASAYGSANNFVASAPVHTFKSTGSSYGSNNIVAPATATLIRTTGSGYGSNGHFATPTMNTIVKSAGSSYGNTENFAVPTINTMAKASASAYGSAGGFVAPATATLIRSTGSAYGGTENFATPIVPSFIGASKSSLIATPTGQPYGIRSTGEYVAYSEEPVDISRCGAVPAENPCSTYGAQYFALSSTPECYIQCAFERAFIRPCPIGLIWNPLISVCDWPTPAPVPAPASDVSYGSGSYGANVALSTPSYSASAVAASAPSYSYGRKKRSIERKKRGMGGMGGMGGLLGGMGGMGGLLGGMGGMGGLLGGFGKPVVSEVPLGPPIPGLLPLPGFPGPIGIPGPLIPPPIFPPFLPPIVPPIGPIPPPILPPPLLPPLGPMIPPLGPMVPPLLPPMVPPLLPPMVPPFLPPLFPPLPIPLPGPLLPPLPMSLPATFIPGPPPIFGAPFLPPFGGPFGPLGGPLGGFGGLGGLGGLGFPSGPDSFFEEPFGDDFGFGGGFPFGDDFYGGARGGYDSYDGYGDKGGYGKNKGYDSYDGYGNKGGYGKNKGYDSYDGYGDKGGYGKSKGYPKRNNYKSNGNFSPKSKGYGGGYGKGYDDDYSSYDDSYSSSYGKNDYDYRRKREYGLNVEQQQQPRAMLSQPIPLNLNQLPSLSSGLISQQPSVVSSYSYAPKTPIVEMPVVPKLVKPSLCIGKPNNTNLPYPNDPTKYISCLNEETFEIMDCPKDLIYNSERDQCEKVKNTEKICERDQPCLNDGQCHQTSPSTYKCTCRGAWTGEHCETPLSSCATNPCGEGNECHTLNANDYKQDYVCVCSGKKSYGLSCDRNTVQNPCIAAPDDHEQYYPFAFSAHAYVQCNGDLLYVRPCAAGLFWNQEEKICDREPTAPLRSFDQPQSYQVETTTKAIPSTSYSSFEKPIDRQQGGRYRTYNPEPAVPTQRELFPQINSRVHLPSTPTYGSSSQDRHIPMTHDFSSKHLQTSMFRPLGQSNLLRTAPFKSTWSLPRMNTQLKTSAYRR